MTESTEAPPTRPVPKGTSVPAGMPRRLAAFVVDLLLLALWLLVVAAALTSVVGPVIVIDPLAAPADRVSADVVRRLAEGAVLVGASAAFFVVPWRRSGGTPGLLLARLRVVDVATGEALSWSGTLRRWGGLGGPLWAAPLLAPSAPVASALVLLAAWLWFLVLLVGTVRDPSRRGLHDRWANSVVVRAHALRPDVSDPEGLA